MPATPPYTPIADIDAKLDIIEHLNQDHIEEVQAIAAYYYPDLAITNPLIIDIYKEGMLISAQVNNKAQELFVDFKLEGDLEEQVLYLAYTAMAEQGRDLTGNKKHYFEVIGKQKLTPNMTRLTLHSETPLPENYAGYAYGMILKVLNKTPLQQTVADKQQITSLTTSIKEQVNKQVKKRGNQAFLWLLKKVSSDRRQKIVKTINKDIRLYTLRSAWKSKKSDFNNQGYMDVFTHGNSAGSLWIETVNLGDIVFSRTETDDKHAHLQEGQTVLIADETAYPALAGILDFWQNDIPPHIVILSQQPLEQDYFDDNEFPVGATIHRIVSPCNQQGLKTLEILKDIESIDGVWGAFESKACKVVRHYLRNERQLTGKQNHIKGYWKATTD